MLINEIQYHSTVLFEKQIRNPTTKPNLNDRLNKAATLLTPRFVCRVARLHSPQKRHHDTKKGTTKRRETRAEIVRRRAFQGPFHRGEEHYAGGPHTAPGTTDA
ncbi:hypothetical protein EVAR_16646_1 [Eumeta japonica]|uniref:Uncharacterized protein n=1 Tax=Eumeta variegata TaxID=151549 RepID=A0A4C1UZH5_EUMVA|nr:hypothetical protein EVAR_16646_1 [Eumeta japonica]